MRQHSLITICVLSLLMLASAVSFAEDITVAIGLSLPPYIIDSENRGMELDVAKEAMAEAGYTLVPKYVPFGRVTKSLSSGAAGAAMTQSPNGGSKGAHLTDPIITYQNVAISLASSNVSIDDINALANYSLVAFQGATSILGPDFAAQAKACPKYNEMADQSKQVLMMFKGRAQVFVGDINIFKYFRQALEESGADVGAKIVIHEVFAPSDFSMAFNDAGVCAKVNTAVAAMRASGRYEEIMNTYIKD